MKKKIIFLSFAIIMSLGLLGCGTKEVKKDMVASTKQQTQEKKEPTQEELNEKLKKEAVEADFVKINAGQAKNMKVFAEGKISLVDNESKLDIVPSFMLSQKKNDGYGIYHIRNILSVKELKDGDTVKIYGVVSDSDKKTGMPIISSTVIDKVEESTKADVNKTSISSGNESKIKELNKNDKESIKKEIEKVLSDKNVTAIDIITLLNGEPKALIQLKGDILKKDEAIVFCKKLGNKIKPICKNYDIELDDKNSQLVLLFDQDGKTN